VRVLGERGRSGSYDEPGCLVDQFFGRNAAIEKGAGLGERKKRV